MSLSANFPTIRPSLLLDFANAKTLDPRITFTRASTATYYDEHTVAKAEENLVLRSQEFDNAAWTKIEVSIAANSVAAPDGNTTADTVTPSTNVARHTVQQNYTSVGATYTYSIFAKANGYNRFTIRESQVSGNGSTFDLGTGTVVANQVGGVGAITSVGNGWYRCTMTATETSGTRAIQILVNSNSGSGFEAAFAGDGTSGIYLWGAQLEQRSAVTAYTPTTTQAITNYVPQLLTAASGVARFEHNPVTRESLGLEIEEGRTNLVLRSEDFSLWSQVNGSAQSDAIVAPDGTLTADKFVANTTFGQHRVEQTFSLTSGTAYTISVYAKAAECPRVALRVANDSANATFDLVTGTVVQVVAGSNATIAPVGNGWYRCAVTGTATATGSAVNARINVYSPAGANDWTGNNWDGLYIWGAQVEAGSFATRYIKTEAAQVTRSADAASMTGANFSSWYRADEGTVYCEGFISPDVDGSVGNYYFALSDGTISNMMHIADINGTRSQIITSGVTQFDQTIGAEPTAGVKAALAYKNNDCVSCVNSSVGSVDTSVFLPSVNQLKIGVRGDFANGTSANGTIKKLAYYPARLTNAALQALTTV